MTKDDLMDNFDEIVTDPRLTLDRVEAHLDGLTGEEGYLSDRYHAIASGGSSGRRGVFVYDWDGWSRSYLGLLRHEFRQWMSTESPSGPVTMATVAASHPTHGSRSVFQTFSRPDFVSRPFPITNPVEETVAGLNELQPMVLSGYPSGLDLLAREAEAGRLRIRPRRIVTFAEPLLPETRARLEQVWGVPVCNWWATSEAFGLAISCGRGPWMHLNDDLVVIEPVDGTGRPTPSGTRSAKLYLTNLYNHTLPLIRYEVTDEITVLDQHCPCGSQHRLVGDVEGRLDESFTYEGVTVHPCVFRSPLGRFRHIVEYQVRQSPVGAEILIRSDGPVDRDALRREIVEDLSRFVGAAQVTLVEVDAITRQDTGKLKRFVPLASAPALPCPV